MGLSSSSTFDDTKNTKSESANHHMMNQTQTRMNTNIDNAKMTSTSSSRNSMFCFGNKNNL
jgi:hypothetical protein